MAGMDAMAFVEDRKPRDAVDRFLERIGEAPKLRGSWPKTFAPAFRCSGCAASKIFGGMHTTSLKEIACGFMVETAGPLNGPAAFYFVTVNPST